MNKENKGPNINKRNFVEMKSNRPSNNTISGTKSPSKNEQYKQYMKFLISTNSEYFQHKSIE